MSPVFRAESAMGSHCRGDKATLRRAAFRRSPSSVARASPRASQFQIGGIVYRQPWSVPAEGRVLVGRLVRRRRSSEGSLESACRIPRCAAAFVHDQDIPHFEHHRPARRPLRLAFARKPRWRRWSSSSNAQHAVTDASRRMPSGLPSLIAPTTTRRGDSAVRFLSFRMARGFVDFRLRRSGSGTIRAMRCPWRVMISVAPARLRPGAGKMGFSSDA